MFVRTVCCLLLITILAYGHSDVFGSTSEISIKVIDENGGPIEGANVGVGFSYNTGSGSNTKGKRGSSNAEGMFYASGQGNGHVTFGAKKEGYYPSNYVYDFNKLGANGWEPRSPELIVVLRKIGNQVPMYGRDTTKVPIEIPATNKDVGFDLIKFDWVAPYGTGKQNDFIFNLKKQVVDNKNFDVALTIKCSNESDGIQLYYEDLQYGSVFKLPRFAPKNGYNNSLLLHEWRTLSDGAVQRNFDFVKGNLNYIFRIRSEVNEGIVEHAMYGKVQGIIDFAAIHSSTAKIYFKFYLNPDGTRNLEFDVNRNLFGTLPRRERVGIK
jgi:hypothetical protein